MPPQKRISDKKSVPEVISDDQPSMKKAISRMLGFLKYRADPKKNKKGEGLSEAAAVLQARTDSIKIEEGPPGEGPPGLTDEASFYLIYGEGAHYKQLTTPARRTRLCWMKSAWTS